MARLKVRRLPAVPLQVWQDVQAHHDVLQQLLYLLIRLLHRARRLARQSGLPLSVLVWGKAVAADKLGVRSSIGGWWWSRGAGGIRLNRGLWFVNRAWLGRGGLTVCEVCL